MCQCPCRHHRSNRPQCIAPHGARVVDIIENATKTATKKDKAWYELQPSCPGQRKGFQKAPISGLNTRSGAVLPTWLLPKKYATTRLMFIRVRKTKRKIRFTIVETRRVAGKVKHEHIGSLGSIGPPITVAGNSPFCNGPAPLPRGARALGSPPSQWHARASSISISEPAASSKDGRPLPGMPAPSFENHESTKSGGCRTDNLSQVNRQTGIVRPAGAFQRPKAIGLVNSATST
jgi:hypothetical protein